MSAENDRSPEDVFTRALAEALPSIQVFDSKLLELQGLFLDNSIDEQEFFRRLINEAPVSGTFLRTADQTLSIDKTKDRKITVEPGQDISSMVTARVAAIIDFDDQGRLRVQGKAKREGKFTRERVILSDYVGVGFSVEHKAYKMAYAVMGIDIAEEDSDTELFTKEEIDEMAKSVRDLPEEEFFPVD